jgi:hypothetical protein
VTLTRGCDPDQLFCRWNQARTADPAPWPGSVSWLDWQLQVFAFIVVGRARLLYDLIRKPGCSW